MDIIKILSEEFSVKEHYVKNIIDLIDSDNTIPFIARYRKEATGSCDDQILRKLSERLTYLRNFEKRKEEIANSITESGNMTDEISKSIENASTLAELEDIYRPFRPKKQTRATVAKAKGLEPLAKLILKQDAKFEPYTEAEKYISEEKGVLSVEDAINGAKDIIAETVSDDAYIRGRVRNSLATRGLITTKNTKDEDSVYSMYYEYSEPVARIPSHRILAINRGEAEKFLKVSVSGDDEFILGYINNKFVKGNSSCSTLVKEAVEDSYKRLIFPSVETEIRNMLTEKASDSAIEVFGNNLEPLIMQPPVKNRVCMGFDPAYRTGCKIAVCDETGKVLDTTVVYPTPPQNKKEEAKKTLTDLIKKHKITLIAIGNGTASKESEIFVADLIKEIGGIEYMMVNEAGASVYSASKLGAEEFPDFDVSLRSAVSIARRLQDPLAELVKIDPKSIGVGQYQHDLPQKQLSETLSNVVEDCVNKVGVDLNTASPSLLSYVSGLSSTVAKNIVLYREEKGKFTSRDELKSVPRLGPKAFEQCAGFLRITDGKNILDNTSVHPESYKSAEKLLKIFSYNDSDVKENRLSDLEEKVSSKGISEIAENLGIGIPTLKDIITELVKPGRDIRDDLPKPLLRSDIMSIEDLTEGMELTGTVRNVIDFGAFIDIGVHQDGLVHISQICERRIKHPSEVLKVGDIVKVKVIETDTKKNRISLTMKF